MEKVHKRSKKRDAILQCICETDVHPSAEWVYQRLKVRIPDLSLGTVYRNIAFFRRAGVIASVGVVDGLERFDGNTAPHAHFICQCCGAVLDVGAVAVPETLTVLAEQATGGSVTACRLSFTGRCRRCGEAETA